MLKKLCSLLLVGLLVTAAANAQIISPPEYYQPRIDSIAKPLLRVLFDQQLIADPITRKIPLNALKQARLQVQNRLNTFVAIPGVNWTERGPNNVGGRTRALMFDPNDVTEKKVWAGGVAGGMWYNNDITVADSTWRKIDDFWDNLAISAIDFDPSKPGTFYAGTGEGYFNSDAVGGGGIWKTSDGGVNWALLTSSVPDYASSATPLQVAFRYVQDLVVLVSRDILVATREGILKSTDGGTTWTVVLTGDNVGDLEKCTDGVLFAGGGSTSGKIYKSVDDGSTWTNVTPAGMPVTAGRVEIGIANSTSGATQVLYVSVSGAFGTAVTGQLVAFLKSTDSGATFTDITANTNNFLGNQGWYDNIVRVNPANANVVVAGGTNFIRTTNGGTTWTTNSYGAHGHPDVHEIVYRPSTPNQAIWASDGGVYYGTDFGNPATTFPTTNFGSRNKNYNVTQYYAAAQKNIAGENYFIAGAQDNGTHKVSNPAIGGASSILGGDGMLCIIDQDESNIQIGSTQQNYHVLFDGNGSNGTVLINDNDGAFVNPMDYDWKNNILYTYKSSSRMSKVTDVGGSNSKTTVTISPSIGSGPIKVANAPNTIFRGSGNTLYRLTNMNTTPVRTAISTGSGFSGNISCVDIGASDDELLVTMSNYNVVNVWYTNNGGVTWASKDDPAFGLPNIPVRYALFNPNNRDQVMIATELGVWSTDDITAANPVWEITNTNLAKVRCDMLRYRSSDGLVIVATHGRGIFSTDVFSAGITPGLTITSPVKASYCLGDRAKFAFTASGTFNLGNTFSLELSDATGSFVSPTVLATTTKSPFPIVEFATSIPTGTDYKIRVTASNVAQTGAEVSIELNSGLVTYNTARTNAGYGVEKTLMLNALTDQNAELNYVMIAKDDSIPSKTNIVNGKNGNGFPAIKSGVLPTAANVYTGEILAGLTKGKEYDIFITGRDPVSSCLTPDNLKVTGKTAGTPLVYTVPTYAPGCTPAISTYITAFTLNGILISNEDFCPNAQAYDIKKSTAVSLPVNVSIPINVNMVFGGGSYYSPGQGVAIWVDIDQNGTFDVAEKLYTSPVPNGGASAILNSSFTIPTTALPGLTTLRIRSRYDGVPSSPTASVQYGEAEDHLVNIINNVNNPRIYSDINIDSASINGSLKIYYSAVGGYNPANTYTFELSDASGSFATPVQLLTNYSGFSPATVTIPSTTLPGINYVVRVKSNNPAVAGFESFPFKLIDDCPLVRTVNSASANVTATFKALNSLTSDQEITGTSGVIFRSNAINLEPGFKADSGVVFLTEIGGCN